MKTFVGFNTVLLLFSNPTEVGNRNHLNLYSTAVYRNLHVTPFSSYLSPNWDCSPKRVITIVPIGEQSHGPGI